MSSSANKSLLHLYRQLLRSAATYPSKRKQHIYEAIQQEFRENASLDPEDEKTLQKIQVAHQGLVQLRQFDNYVMTGGDTGSPNWNVMLTQNPMPRPNEKDESN